LEGRKKGQKNGQARRNGDKKEGKSTVCVGMADVPGTERNRAATPQKQKKNGPREKRGRRDGGK